MTSIKDEKLHMEVYLDGEDIDVWEVLDLLDRNQAIQVIEHLKSTLDPRSTHGEKTLQEREFEDACEKLQKHRGMLSREIEEQIIDIAKKYTL
jgi:hypothetical protein